MRQPGAQTTAAISGDSAAAGQARRAAAVLIDAGMKPDRQPAPERAGRATSQPRATS